MPISEAHVGRKYPPTPPYLVTQAKIAEFARALGEPALTEVAPPTFVAVLAAEAWGALFADPELGLSLDRTVHVDQSFEWRQPLRVGDEATAELTINKVRLRGDTAIVTVSVMILVADEVVATASSTLMHSGGAK